MKDYLYNIMLQRRSIRKFKNDMINKEDIDYLLELAMSAPSACNKQPWEFYVISNPELLKVLNNAGKYTNISAPLAIVVCGNLERSLTIKDNDYWIQDCSAAIENILLGCTALHLGSLWCGAYPQKTVVNNLKVGLNLKDNLIPLGIIYIGYPDEEKVPRTQYNKEYIHYR